MNSISPLTKPLVASYQYRVSCRDKCNLAMGWCTTLLVYRSQPVQFFFFRNELIFQHRQTNRRLKPSPITLPRISSLIFSLQEGTDSLLFLLL